MVKVKFIAGVDEAGRGPLAGPVVAAAVVFKKGYRNPDIKDSKQLSPQNREQLVGVIKRECVGWSVIAIGPRRIERMNIREASRLAMSMAASRVKADLILVDGDMPISTFINQRVVIGGDDKHVEISAASILAKTYRDSLMLELNKRYPGYGFDRHFGYGTVEHRLHISRLGPCRIHRRTFHGVKEFVKGSLEEGVEVIPKDLESSLVTPISP